MKISSTCSLKGLVVQNAVQEIAERLGGSLNSSTFLIAHGDAHNTGDTGAVQYTGRLTATSASAPKEESST